MSTETATLKDTALGMLKGLIETATQAGDFIKEQIPLVVQELLRFNTAKAILCFVLSVLFAVAVAAVVRLLVREHSKAVKSNGYYNDGYGMGAVVVGLFGGFASLLCVVGTAIDLLKITLAPRVWLIEYASSLVK